MAKNRVMAAKNLKAKQLRQKAIRERNIVVMCHETAPREVVEYIAYKPTEFSSTIAIKCRINAFMGKEYNIIRFQKRYPEIYMYILSHTPTETKVKFEREFDLIMRGLL